MHAHVTVDTTMDTSGASAGRDAASDPDQTRVGSSTPAARGPNVPPRLPRYGLIRKLGEGAMGQVWLAHDPQLSREVAIKLVRADSGPSGRMALQRLAHEARALARLSDPHVVTVFDVGSYAIDDDPDAGVFIVMELIVGVTLAQWLTRRRTTAAILEVFDQAAQGLAAAHEAGMVHRDFKPANVFVGDDGRVRVGDFGLARRGGEDPGAPRRAPATAIGHELVETLATGITEDGTVVGTPLYMPPEQHRGATLDARSDQYAFCVALYEALTGTRPFAGSMQTLFDAKQAQQPARARAGRELPRRLHHALMRGLSPAPEDRWPSMRALMAELAPPRRARLRWPAAATVAGVLAVVTMPTRDREAPCAGRDRLDAAWTPAARERLQRFVASVDDAARAGHVVAQLDAHVAELRAAIAGACRSGSAGDDVCLHDATTEFGATIEALSQEERAAHAALATIAGLTTPSRCAERPDAAGVDDPAVLALRDRATTARALWNANLLDPGLRLALDARDEAVATPAASALLPPLQYQIGGMQQNLGQVGLAEQTFEDAYHRAIALDVHRTAAQAAVELATLASESGDVERATLWRRHFDASAARAEFTTCEAIHLGMQRATSEIVERDIEGIEAQLQKLSDDCERNHCGERCLVIAANHAVVLRELGRAEDAVAAFREVLRRALELRGPDALPTAIARIDLAEALTRTGELDETLEQLDLAEAGAALRGAPTHPRRASVEKLRSRVLRERGDIDAALAAARRAVEIAAHSFDPTHPQMLMLQATYANLLGDAGDNPGAIVVYDGILAATADSDTTHALTQVSRGYTRMELGDIAGAVADALEARALLLRHAPYDARDLVFTFSNEAAAWARAGACERAHAAVAAGLRWATEGGHDREIEMLNGERELHARDCPLAP
ncbi:MAG: serine/threonine protein kinase [Deltaproteobacteria bacterium]|nr:serine/threonine protein kinase [Deltaproteobacteria bacterium]